MVEFKEQIEREKLPKNTAIPIVVSFSGVLMKYTEGEPTPIVYFDPVTRSFGELPSPIKRREM